MARWTMDIAQYARKKQVEIKDVRKAYTFALYSSIVKKTPVDTGRARANWNIAVGNPDSSVSDGTMKSGMKYRSFGEVPGSDGDEPVYISNNLPYIETLEYGGYPNPPKGGEGKTENGFSKQAPEGMVGVTIANSEAIFNAALKAVRGK